MLDADFMKSPNDRPLEKRERSIRVNIPAYPLISGMIYALVLSFLVFDAFVGFIVIGSMEFV